MLFWFPVMTLMVEAVRVIEMRLQMIVPGKGTSDEMFLMVTEKLDAMGQAKAIVIPGGNPSLIIDISQDYRSECRAVIRHLRLSLSRPCGPHYLPHPQP
jgi:hypothetical protein